MKKLFLISVLAMLSAHVLAAPKEASTDTASDSICMNRSTDLKMKMKEVEELLAQSAQQVDKSNDSKVISQ